MARFIPLERDIQKAILAVAKCHGFMMSRRNTAAMTAQYKGRKRFIRMGEPGDSDLTGIVPGGPHLGKRIDVEIKRPGNRPTKDQIASLQRTIAAGGIACWLDNAIEADRVFGMIKQGVSIEIDDKGNQTMWRDEG